MSDCLLSTTTSRTENILVLTAGSTNKDDIITATATECYDTIKGFKQIRTVYVLYQEEEEDICAHLFDGILDKIKQLHEGNKRKKNIKLYSITFEFCKITENIEAPSSMSVSNNEGKIGYYLSRIRTANYGRKIYINITLGPSVLTSNLLMYALWMNNVEIYSRDSGNELQEFYLPPIKEEFVEPFSNNTTLNLLVKVYHETNKRNAAISFIEVIDNIYKICSGYAEQEIFNQNKLLVEAIANGNLTDDKISEINTEVQYYDKITQYIEKVLERLLNDIWFFKKDFENEDKRLNGESGKGLTKKKSYKRMRELVDILNKGLILSDEDRSNIRQNLEKLNTENGKFPLMSLDKTLENIFYLNSNKAKSGELGEEVKRLITDDGIATLLEYREIIKNVHKKKIIGKDITSTHTDQTLLRMMEILYKLTDVNAIFRGIYLKKILVLSYPGEYMDLANSISITDGLITHSGLSSRMSGLGKTTGLIGGMSKSGVFIQTDIDKDDNREKVYELTLKGRVITGFLLGYP